MFTNGKNGEAASQRMELYCMKHPGTPSAVRSPKLFFKSGTWVALLGDNIEDGITGFGSSIEGALRAFDLVYRQSLPPAETEQ